MESEIEIVWHCKNCGTEVDECDGCKEHFMLEDKIECVFYEGSIWHVCQADCIPKEWKK